MLYDIIYMLNLKNNTNESIFNTETDSQTDKLSLWLPKGIGSGEGQELINRNLGLTDTNVYTQKWKLIRNCSKVQTLYWLIYNNIWQ